MEEWKVYEKNTRYSVSNMGRVKVFCSRRKVLVDIKAKRKGTYNFISDSSGFYILLRNLVAEVWIPNPNNHECVLHINEDTHDNKASNLEWFHRQNGRKPKINLDFIPNEDVLLYPAQPIRLPKIIDNRYSVFPIPGTTQWSVYFIESKCATHLGIYESQKEAEETIH